MWSNALGQVPEAPMPLEAQQQRMAPGYFKLRDGTTVYIQDASDYPIYDTEWIPAGVIPAGQQYNFFRSPAYQATGVAKDLLDTNMRGTMNQLPSGWRGIVYGLYATFRDRETGAGTGVFTTFADIKRIFHGGFMQFQTGSQKTELEGLLLHYPSPYGLYGNVGRAAAAPIEAEVLSNGVPSVGAVPHRPIKVDLTNELTFQVDVTFPDGFTLDAICLLRIELGMFIWKPVR